MSKKRKSEQYLHSEGRCAMNGPLIPALVSVGVATSAVVAEALVLRKASRARGRAEALVRLHELSLRGPNPIPPRPTLRLIRGGVS